MYIAKIRLIAIILSLALSQVKSNNSSSFPCNTICNDKPERKGKSCVGNEVNCNDSLWKKKGLCRLSCYNAGFGYEGDVCCNESNDDD